MVDTILVDPGSSGGAKAVATDDIGGVHYQRIKAGWGADGVFQETADTDGVRLPVGGAQIGTLTETAPTTDTASSGLNGRLQRIAQRLTSLIGLLPAALGAGGGLKVDGSGTALPVSGTFWQATQPVSGTVTANAGTNASTAALGAATATDPGGTTASLQVVGAASNLRLVGFSARETTGTAGAVFNLRHGTSNAGALLATVSLGVGESAREWFGPDGIAAASGIWLERVSGSSTVVGYSKVAA